MLNARLPTPAGSEERAEDGGDFFDNDAQAQVALPQFGIHFVIRPLGAFQNAQDIGLMFGKTLGVRMTRVTPVAKQPLPVGRNAPQ